MSSEDLPEDLSPRNLTKIEPPTLSISSGEQRDLMTTEEGKQYSNIKGLAATVSKRWEQQMRQQHSLK